MHIDAGSGPIIDGSTILHIYMMIVPYLGGISQPFIGGSNNTTLA